MKNKESNINDSVGYTHDIVEPFKLNSLPKKYNYDEGVVLSSAKLYNYILEQDWKDKRPISQKFGW